MKPKLTFTIYVLRVTDAFTKNMTDPGHEIIINTSPIKGRFLCTSKLLNPGDIFLSDTPLVQVCVSNEYCSHCLIKLNDPNRPRKNKNQESSSNKIYRCLSCQREFYCSRQCQILAWKKYHWFECQMHNVFKDPANDKLALRLLLISAYNGVPIQGIAKENQHQFENECSKEIIELMFKNFENYKLHLASLLDNIPLTHQRVTVNARRMAAIVSQAIRIYTGSQGEEGEEPKLTRELLVFGSSGISGVVERFYDQKFSKISFFLQFITYPLLSPT